MKKPRRFTKISDYFKFANLTPPAHPLIGLVDYSQVRYHGDLAEMSWVQDYYTIGLKRNIPYKFFYGQQEYDFDEGVMAFVAPNQVFSFADNPNIGQTPTGRLLLIHPDFLWNTPLANQIGKYDFFGYSIHEALFLSDKEESMILDILNRIEQEYLGSIDKFSQKIIISHIEVLLNYCERFYERQFITRKISNHHVLSLLENILNDYFTANDGCPSVEWVAQKLNLTPNYLSSLLKSQTGQSTQQHIHHKLIESAKEQLATTQLSISEIAYKLGFEYPSSFSKLFKNKTEMSPVEFRKSFH